jgi:hypothetical protein
MFKLMECVARVVFCTPITPEGYNFENMSRVQKALHVTAVIFDLVDLVDTVLDTVEGVKLWMSGHGVYGFFLLLGIFLARLVASKGRDHICSFCSNLGSPFSSFAYC